MLYRPITGNDFVLAHPKGLVAFLPLKINKEKSNCSTNAVLNSSSFSSFFVRGDKILPFNYQAVTRIMKNIR